MPTITLTPKNFGKKIGEIYDRVLSAERLIVHFDTTASSAKKSAKKKSPRAMVDDPKNTSYGPYTAEEFIAQMKKW